MATERDSFVLASSSPRRRELLAKLGLDFAIVPSDVDETALPDEQPADLARRLSLAKGEAVASGRDSAVVISADTSVVLGERVLGKPADSAEAVAMLLQLRARQHLVYTGLAVLWQSAGRRCVQLAATPVVMRAFTLQEIERYVATGDPLDKAGAYAIQAPSFDPVARIEGCYANVVGLPLCHLYRVLEAWGIPVPVHPLASCPWAVRHGCSWSAEITAAPAADWCPS